MVAFQKLLIILKIICKRKKLKELNRINFVEESLIKNMFINQISKLLTLLYLLSLSTIASSQLEIVPRMPEEIVAGDSVNELLPITFHLVPNISFGVPIKLLIVSESNSPVRLRLNAHRRQAKEDLAVAG